MPPARTTQRRKLLAHLKAHSPARARDLRGAGISATAIARERTRAALRKTFARRNTEFPVARPPGLSGKFSQDPEKVTQWAAYSEATELEAVPFRSVVDEIWEWIAPICREVDKGD